VHPIERLRAVARAREVDQRHLAHEAARVLSVMGTDSMGLVTSCRRLIDRHPAAGALWWTCARLIEARDPRAEGHRTAGLFADAVADDPVVDALALDLPDGAVVAVVPDPAGGSEVAADLSARRFDLALSEARDVDDPWCVEDLLADDLLTDDDVGGAVFAEGAGDLSAEGGAAEPQVGHGTERVRPKILVVEAAAIGPRGALVRSGTDAAVIAVRARGAAVWLAAGSGRHLPPPLFDLVVERNPGAEVLARSAVDRTVEPWAETCPCPPELLRAPRGW
jgi:hypothetical protein